MRSSNLTLLSPLSANLDIKIFHVTFLAEEQEQDISQSVFWRTKLLDVNNVGRKENRGLKRQESLFLLLLLVRQCAGLNTYLFSHFFWQTAEDAHEEGSLLFLELYNLQLDVSEKETMKERTWRVL
jgi:hypothetical protein